MAIERALIAQATMSMCKGNLANTSLSLDENNWMNSASLGRHRMACVSCLWRSLVGLKGGQRVIVPWYQGDCLELLD